MKKWLVHGNAGFESHENNVRTAFLAAAPDGWECDIVMSGSGTPSGAIIAYNTSFAQACQLAIANGYAGITRSYTGMWNQKVSTDFAVANAVLAVMPHGSNTNEELSNPPRIFSAMACSGGVSSNVGSWGNGLELFDQTIDALFGSDSTAQSFATPTVAGRIAHLLDAGFSIWDARQAIRQICELPGTETAYPEWSPEEGYGKADFFPLPASPLGLDIPAPLDILTEILDAGERVRCSWMNFRTTRQHATRIKLAGGLTIYEGRDELFEWEPDRAGAATIEFYHLDRFGNPSPFADHAVREVSGLVFVPPRNVAAQRRGGRVILWARRSAPHLRYRWYRDGELVAETKHHHHTDLVGDADVLTYTCRYFNPVTQQESADSAPAGVGSRLYRAVIPAGL